MQTKEFYEKYPYPARGFKTKEEFEKYSSWFYRKTRLAKKDLKGKIVLDAGCGTGELSTALALQEKTAKIFALDLSLNSLKKAYEYKKKFDLKNLFLIEGDAKQLPFEKKFDLIIALGSIHHDKETEKAFSSLTKQLKKKGIFVVGFYNVFSRVRNKIRKNLLKLLSWGDLEKRIALARTIFPYTQHKSDSWIADKFCVPVENHFSFEKAQKLMSREKLKLIHSDPDIKKKGIPFKQELEMLIRKENAFFILVGKR